MQSSDFLELGGKLVNADLRLCMRCCMQSQGERGVGLPHRHPNPLLTLGLHAAAHAQSEVCINELTTKLQVVTALHDSQKSELTALLAQRSSKDGELVTLGTALGS
jgi:hypothetical protein